MIYSYRHLMLSQRVTGTPRKWWRGGP